MKIKLTYEEACSVLRQELGQYLALNEIDPDIEIEIEKATTGLPTLTAVDITDELKRRSEERKQEKLIEADRINNPPVIGGKMNGEPVEEWPVEKSLEAIDHVKELADGLPKNQATQLLEKLDGQLTWQPDGKTPPPSADAFMAWAKGKKIRMTYWGKGFFLKAESIDPNNHLRFLARDEDGTHDDWPWNDGYWQEYTDAN